MTISRENFGVSSDGQDASLWTVKNPSGLCLSLTDWGATVVSVLQPDRRGDAAEVTLGFADASRYVPSAGYLGATCGRFANRIAGGRFILDGRPWELSRNSEPNHLHGGDRGFNAKMWKAEPYSEGNRTGVVFTLISPDGDEGYPGSLTVTADYALDERNRLFMDFRAETDAATIVNITNHTYWNPAAKPGGTIQDVELTLHASYYLPVDQFSIPTGVLVPVKGTPMDFRRPKRIGAEFDEMYGGYDHCMAIDGDAGELRIAAEARDPESGRRLSLYTDRPGVQFYTGNNLHGAPFPKHGGFCLEPQAFPDSPNNANFPSTELYPGEVYHHRSVVEFGAD